MTDLELNQMVDGMAQSVVDYKRTHASESKASDSSDDTSNEEVNKPLMKAIAHGHALSLFDNTQATRNAKAQSLITRNKGVALNWLEIFDSKLLATTGVNLRTVFATNSLENVLEEVAEFWNNDVKVYNTKVLVLAELNVIPPRELPYFLLSPVDFSKGCRRRFFQKFKFLATRYNPRVTEAVYKAMAKLHKNGMLVDCSDSE